MKCIHLSECMEQRGRCREYKSLEDIQNDVRRINENFGKKPAGAEPKDED